MLFNSPESIYSWAKQHQQELIAEADRERVLSAARRARRARRAAQTAERRADRAGPGHRGAAVAAGA